MNTSWSSRCGPRKPRYSQPFLETATVFSAIEVEAIVLRDAKSFNAQAHCEVCQPGDLPDMFSVYLRHKPEEGGLARCVADFTHPDDAIAWASDLARQMCIELHVGMDLEAIKARPISVGESVIFQLDMNAICGSVESVDELGVAVLFNCFDMFGQLGKSRISLGHCRRFWEPPRLLGMEDIIRAAA